MPLSVVVTFQIRPECTAAFRPLLRRDFAKGIALHIMQPDQGPVKAVAQ